MKILVGSLLPGQERLIEAECPAGVDLRFVDSDVSPSQWARMARQCDHTIVVAKFISHKHTDALKAACVKFHTHHGGLSNLKKLIKEIADGDLGTEKG